MDPRPSDPVYIAPAWGAYSLVAVGGSMKVQHVSASGEIIVCDELRATGVVHLVGNDYAAVLPVVCASAVVLEDNFPVLGTVHATKISGEPSDAQLEAWFGTVPVVTEDDDECESSPIRAGILGSGTS